MTEAEETAEPAPRLGAAAMPTGGFAIDVCICTYRRPSIVETLRGIAAQELPPQTALRVIVADNAADAEARARVCAAGQEFGLDVVYVHAPEKNISIARNACLGAADAAWLAFVDDDERPSPIWLKELIAEAQRGDWDAVLGPVQALYPDTAPSWLKICDLHSTRPVWIEDRIETGYTGNVLFRRALIQRDGLAFRVELGRSGGEDLDFFYRFRDVGGRIGYAPAALVYETVPLERTTLAYLLRRNFRQGQTHARRLQQSSALRPPILHVPLALAKAFLLGMAACRPCAAARNRLLARAALHCGVIARFAGFAEIKLY